jgi:hypothetical protein
MKAKTILWVLVCCVVLLIGSCGNPWMEKIVDPLFDVTEPLIPEPETPVITEPVVPPPVITAFYFTINGEHYGVGAGVESGSGSISAHTITVFLPPAIYDTNISSLIPKIEVSPSEATILPASGEAQNFSSERTYKVTSAGGSSSYTVRVARTHSLPSGDGTLTAESGLRDLIKNANSGDTLILSGEFPVSIPDPNNSNVVTIYIINKAVTILAPPGETLRFSLGADSRMFEVLAGGTLTLGGAGSGDIVLDGGAKWKDGGTPAGGAQNDGRNSSEPLVDVRKGGKFIMNAGVTLQNNESRDTAQASALDLRGEAIINGGTIKNCKSNSPYDDSSTIYLGSVDGSRAHLTINGGLITGNTASGGGGSIMVNREGPHTLIWNGGTITGNTPANSNYGSIYVEEPSKHTIKLYSTAR